MSFCPSTLDVLATEHFGTIQRGTSPLLPTFSGRKLSAVREASRFAGRHYRNYLVFSVFNCREVRSRRKQGGNKNVPCARSEEEQGRGQKKKNETPHVALLLFSRLDAATVLFLFGF